MERRTGAPRAGWHKTVTEQGLVYDAPGRGQGGAERPYWDESVHYVFAMDEILALEADVELLHSMCLEAVDHVVTTERFRDFALPEWSWEAVAASWKRHDPHVYGRFDLRYDGRGPCKMLEYNADTPDHAARGVDPAVVLAQGHPPRRRPVELAAREARRALGRDRGRAAAARGALHLVVRRRHRRGPRDGRLPAGDGRRGRARHRRAGDRGHRLGLGARPLRRPRGGPDGRGLQALPLGVGAQRRLRQARRSAASPRRCGSSRCGSRC